MSEAQEPETMFVVVPDRAVAPRRAPTPAEPPRRRLRVTIPSELADELKQAVAVLPGCSLDQLVEEALARVLAERGAPAPRPPPRGKHNSSIIVLTP
jgi:hypothetical protein